jgi:hypothetical protein
MRRSSTARISGYGKVEEEYGFMIIVSIVMDYADEGDLLHKIRGRAEEMKRQAS